MDNDTRTVPSDSFSDADKDAIYRVMHSRRDVRRFLPDAIPDDVLRRILTMGHYAPSVGFMQPWSFIVIRSPDVRRAIKAQFEEKNACELEKITDQDRKDLYSRLKLEGILEAPLNIAVTCDRNRDAPFVLGRAPMPETDLFSTCLAIQNMWLAARAEGVGIGWVSILDKEATERLLGLPPETRLVAYLCVGYPVEFRAKPMLEEVGWKQRMPLESVVFEDRWGAHTSLFETCEARTEQGS
jgi:5,6-dimethylbenzimidazole synthase